MQTLQEKRLGSELPFHGIPRDQIFAELARNKAQDCAYASGRVWAYTYDPGADVAAVSRQAYMEYLHESAIDPTNFPSVVRLERDVVRMIAQLLRGDEAIVGNMTTGGTESILLAMKTARDWARAERGITEPEIIVPMTAHPSFHKACAYFNIKPVIVPFDPVTFEADVAAMRRAITGNTILLAGSACGYAQGVIDPICEIAALAQEHGVLCHVDGCVGGIHFSLMRRMGYSLPDFDFSIPGVTSISADMHKYGYAPKNASVILYRNKELRRHQIFASSCTTTYALTNPTILSTKSGGPMAGSWATLLLLGEEGYQRIIRRVMDATARLIEGVNGIPGLRVLGKPQMCMFSFAAEGFNIYQLQDEMKRRGWYLQPQFSTPLSPENLHVTVNANAVDGVEAFLADLREGVAAVKTCDAPLDLTTVREQVRAILDGHSTESAIAQLQAMIGIEGSELPEGMAMLNSVMDALPNPIREGVLIGYFNDLYT